MKTFRFDGPDWRVQLKVLPPLERYINGKVIIDDQATRFVVNVLSQRYHASTSFSGRAGHQVYYGDSFAAAWGTVWQYAPGSTAPKALRKYADEPQGKPLTEILD